MRLFDSPQRTQPSQTPVTRRCRYVKFEETWRASHALQEIVYWNECFMFYLLHFHDRFMTPATLKVSQGHVTESLLRTHWTLQQRFTWSRRTFLRIVSLKKQRCKAFRSSFVELMAEQATGSQMRPCGGMYEGITVWPLGEWHLWQHRVIDVWHCMYSIRLQTSWITWVESSCYL